MLETPSTQPNRFYDKVVSLISESHRQDGHTTHFTENSSDETLLDALQKEVNNIQSTLDLLSQLGEMKKEEILQGKGHLKAIRELMDEMQPLSDRIKTTLTNFNQATDSLKEDLSLDQIQSFLKDLKVQSKERIPAELETKINQFLREIQERQEYS